MFNIRIRFSSRFILHALKYRKYVNFKKIWKDALILNVYPILFDHSDPRKEH